MMTREEKLAYQRGYTRAALKGWPEHRPPMPPHCLVASIIRAAMGLRDAVDGFLATLEEDDELEQKLGSKIDALDEAMKELGVWVRVGEEVKELLPGESA